MCINFLMNYYLYKNFEKNFKKLYNFNKNLKKTLKNYIISIKNILNDSYLFILKYK